jgi:hypothetical protein
MRESTEVRLVVTSPTVTAADLQTRLNLKPDDSWKLGEERGTFKNKEKFHGFVVESGHPLLGFEDQLRELIKRMAASAVTLGQLAQHVKAQVQCRLLRKQIPQIDIPRDELRWLAAMGASLEIDIQVEAPPPAQAGKPGDKDEKKPGF